MKMNLCHFCAGLLLVIFLEGSYLKEQVVQLRREKRDVDIFAACDEHCLPEDEIKDYDILLQYDEDPDSTPGPFLHDFDRKSCAFACKIVDMNQTKGLKDILGGEFTIMSVEDLSNGNDAKSPHFNPLTTMVGLRKNVTFSPSFNENVAIRSELLNETSTCVCANDNTNTANETSTTPLPKTTDKYATESTTTHKQQFSVLPVVPKVIRFTVVEAEMAEAGGSPDVEKTQVKSYFDDSNNASLVLKNLVEKLTQHGALGTKGILDSLGLGNLSQDIVKTLINQNSTINTLSPKVNQVSEEVTTVSQPVKSQEPTVGTIEYSATINAVSSPIEKETTEMNLHNKTLNSRNQTAFSSLNKTDANYNHFDNPKKEHLPLPSEKPSITNNVADKERVNATSLHSSDPKESNIKGTNLRNLTLADISGSNNSTDFHNESFSQENLKWTNITSDLDGELSNTSNSSSILSRSQDLQEIFPSTWLSNMTDFSIHNNITVGNNSNSPHNLQNETNGTAASMNKTTSLHKVSKTY